MGRDICLIDEPFAKFAPQYWEKGFNVIPIRRGTKHPHVSWGRWKGRRQTQEELQDLIQRFPGADIACVMGRIWWMGEEGYVICVDEDQEGAFQGPPTACWRSKRGINRLYLTNEPIRTRRLKGFEILGEGSYVVFPPSGGRVWVKNLRSMRLLPASRLPLPRRQARPSPPKLPPHVGEKGVPEGMRNVTLSSLVGTWRGQGLTKEEILSKALSWNQKNMPPLDESEVTRTVDSTLKTIAQRFKERCPLSLYDVHVISEELTSTETLVLQGLILLSSTLGVDLGEPFDAPHRVLARWAKVSARSIPQALRTLRDKGFIELGKERDPTNPTRRVTVVRLLVGEV
jgi:hypothetical protein